MFAGLTRDFGRHAGVAAAVAVASAVLVGALCVGDSVRFTLARAAFARTGQVDAALVGGDRFFRAELPEEVCAESRAELGNEQHRTSASQPLATVAAPVLQLLGVAATPRGDRRVQDVRVHGVDSRFFALGPAASSAPALAPPKARGAYVSATLARALAVAPGDFILVRVERPSAMPRDLALAPDDDIAAMRLEVERVLGADEFGAFALDTSPAPPASVFVDLEWLQAEMEVPGLVNLALFGGTSGVASAASREPGASERTLAALQRGLDARWKLADVSLYVQPRAGGQYELATRRLFLDEPLVDVLDQLDVAPMTGVFTYFVNSIADGERRIPYSMVSALGPLGRHAPSDDPLLALAQGLRDDELRLNAWAMADLAPKVGASIDLEYYVVDAARRLVTHTQRFTLAGEAPEVFGGPLEGTEQGRELMPDFPGLADAESCREWEPGTPVDLDAIRAVDEAYWDDYRGTPKAFVTLSAGRAAWASRFGALSGVRFSPADEGALLAALRERVTAASLGLTLRDVAGAAQRASGSATDFGGLFIGLSFFLVAAALLLTVQLFLFGVEARASELGLLGALGLRAKRVRRLVLGEVALVAAVGAVLGAPLGILYTRLVLRGLDSLWAEAVARTPIEFHATPTSVALGAALALSSSLAAAAFAVRGLRRHSALQLLQSQRGVFEDGSPSRMQRSARRGLLCACVCALVAIAVAATVDPAAGSSASGAYFGAGAGLVIGVLGLGWWWLHRQFGAARATTSLIGLGLTHITRRRGRSLGTAASMGLGTFLVLAVGANRIGPVRDVHDRTSGTGGFAFYGRSSLPLRGELVEAQTLSAEGALDGATVQDAARAAALDGVSFVPLRVRDGDDASCLNLAQSSSPRLLGVDPEALAQRGAFSFAKVAGGVDAPWRLLEETLADGPLAEGPDAERSAAHIVVPAIGDVTSLTWQLKLGVGDRLTYQDERGREFEVEIVAALADTVLQGDLLISARHFEALFPSESGSRRVLVDVPRGREAEVRAFLGEEYADVGLALEPSGERLATFHAVQNTYLAIFQALGALGVLLGSVGLGLLVLRNTEERRGELALLGALGFRRRRARALLAAEYAALVGFGLLAGGAGAALAMVPAMSSAGGAGSLPYVGALFGLVAVNAALWVALAVVGLTGPRGCTGPEALRAE